MSHEFDTETKVLNERWDGKYIMICDVIHDNRTISAIKVEALPPHKEAEVFFPTSISLKADDKSRIETAVLSHYYNLDASE